MDRIQREQGEYTVNGAAVEVFHLIDVHEFCLGRECNSRTGTWTVWTGTSCADQKIVKNDGHKLLCWSFKKNLVSLADTQSGFIWTGNIVLKSTQYFCLHICFYCSGTDEYIILWYILHTWCTYIYYLK
jgi:hypothetical protein